jgi:hypothetical protein
MKTQVEYKEGNNNKKRKGSIWEEEKKHTDRKYFRDLQNSDFS